MATPVVESSCQAIYFAFCVDDYQDSIQDPCFFHFFTPFTTILVCFEASSRKHKRGTNTLAL